MSTLLQERKSGRIGGEEAAPPMRNGVTPSLDDHPGHVRVVVYDERRGPIAMPILGPEKREQ